MRTPSQFWLESPSNVAHLAQNKVETVLRNHISELMNNNNNSDYLRGYTVTNCKILPNSSVITALNSNEKHEIECKYLIGADGANSFIRNKIIGVPMKGKEKMQHLMNVHFSCPGLRIRLKPKTAMLYFVFNEVKFTIYLMLIKYTYIYI